MSSGVVVLRISKLADYAILVMVELAREPGAVLSAQVLSDRAGIELPTASKVLKLLSQAGLLVSYRGPTGGYAMERSTKAISVAEVIKAIEGPIAMTECSVHKGLCSVEADCNARDNWQKISRAVAGALQAVTLADMAAPSDGGSLTVPALKITTLSA